MDPAQNANGVKDLIGVLVSWGKLSPEQAEQARVSSASTDKTERQILIDMGITDEDLLIKAEAEVWGIPFFDQPNFVISTELLNLVPKTVAESYSLVPVGLSKEKGLLSVVMAKPQDLTGIDFLEKKTGMKLKIYASTPSWIDQTISRNYSTGLIGEVSDVLKRGGEDDSSVGVVTVESMAAIIKEPKIVEIVKKVLEYAVRLRASDIHIEPSENDTRIRYRVDGILEEKLRLERQYHAALVSRIKILSNIKIDEKRIPQDGRFNFKSDDGEVDLRISTLPTVHGEKVVMRLLRKNSKVPSLPDLGLRGKALKNLSEAVNIPHGIILITGPTGSGKTTTLYSLLTKINTPRVNIVTLEDPVEYQMAGINQVQTNPQAGLTFASGLRSFLRQDPNIIMVGEIRDEETAGLAVQASLTGHLVFSTIHTNSAAGALPRLIDMKAEPFLLASSMTAIVAQRVLRKVCENCRVSYAPEKTVLDDIKKVLDKLYEGFIKSNSSLIELAKKQNSEVLLFKGQGCEKCSNTGYIGRIAIFEVLPVTNGVAKLILERSDAATIERKAVDEGMIQMKQDGYLKALEGVTTIEEVIRVAQI